MRRGTPCPGDTTIDDRYPRRPRADRGPCRIGPSEKVALYGRVSTDDAQDPSLSIPRKLAKCNEALKPIGEKMDIAFWDAESGRKRRQNAASSNWTHEVEKPADPVILESTDHLAMTDNGTQVEHRLEVDERHLREETW